MKISKSLISLAAVSSLIFSVPLLARQNTPSAPNFRAPVPNLSPLRGTSLNKDPSIPSFADLDKRHKGSLNRSDIPKDVEGLKALRAHFPEADRDGNGRLSPQEYNTYIASKVQSPEDGQGQ